MRLAIPEILLLIWFGAVAGAAGSPPAGNGPTPGDRARALEGLVEHAPTDSLRLELARAYRDAGRYHDARRQLARYLESNPHDADARFESARLRLREMLYRFDPSGLNGVLDELTRALDDAPDRRDALFLTAVVCHLALGVRGNDVPALIRRGTEYLNAILAADPRDPGAHLFLGVLLTDVDRLDDAYREFELGLDASPPEVRAAFLSSRWATGSSERTHHAASPSPERERANAEAWLDRDPTPLTVINENQIEIWRRLVVADCLFGRSESGLRGWETQAGETYVRYGQPQASGFDPGGVSGGPEVDQPPGRAHGSKSKAEIDFYKANLEFDAPAWRWDYRFRDLDVSLTFQDMNLNGIFLRSGTANRTLDSLRRVAPVVFHETTPGELGPLFLAAVGTVRKTGFVSEAISLGIPGWRGGSGADRYRGCWLEVTVEDSIGTEVVRDQARVSADTIHPLLSDREVILFRRSYDLLPGRYTLTAYVRDDRTDEHGALTLPVTVRPYGVTRSLEVSDLELVLPVDPGSSGPAFEMMGRTVIPDPMGLVGDGRNLDVAYELYGLAARDSVARYTVRYTVLPRAYVLGFDRHVRQGRASADQLVPLAAAGMAIEDVPLGPSDYSDVRFPEETARLTGTKTVKGARVDVSRLEPGEYALVVTVEDVIIGHTASARTLFRILSDEGLRKLLTASSRHGR